MIDTCDTERYPIVKETLLSMAANTELEKTKFIVVANKIDAICG